MIPSATHTSILLSDRKRNLVVCLQSRSDMENTIEWNNIVVVVVVTISARRTNNLF